MTFVRVITMLTALAFAHVASADPTAKPTTENKADKPASKAPADKAAPDKPPADKPTKKVTISDADAQRFLAFFDKLVGVVVANQDDCAKMATGINGLIDANQALLDEAAAARNQNKELPPAVKDKIEKKAREELTPAMMKKCSADKTVQTAFMRMGASRKK